MTKQKHIEWLQKQINEAEKLTMEIEYAGTVVVPELTGRLSAFRDALDHIEGRDTNKPEKRRKLVCNARFPNGRTLIQNYKERPVYYTFEIEMIHYDCSDEDLEELKESGHTWGRIVDAVESPIGNAMITVELIGKENK